jgi:hypothetical protein
VGRVCGPYTGEFAWEILCWIPFLRAELGEDFKNATVISRGGTEAWYPCKVINAYSVIPPNLFKAAIDERIKFYGTSKSLFGDRLDNFILHKVGYRAVNYHPLNILYGESTKYADWSHHCERFSPVEPYPGLPERYVAMRFYKNQWLYQVPEVKEDLPIVALHITDQPDNHAQLDFTSDLIVNYDAYKSFHVLTRVISHAERFYCNYGSMAHLGISCGTDTIAYTHYPDEARSSWHYNKEPVVAKKCGASFEVRHSEPRHLLPFVQATRYSV